MRAEFSRRTKEAAWVRSGGLCDVCRLTVKGRAEYDHILECALGGDNSVENCQVLCAPCHRAKTDRNIALIRKADRQRDKGTGAKAAKGPAMPGTKRSPWRKRLDGSVERRR